VLADPARQLFGRTIVAIWDDRCDVHSTLRPFRSNFHVERGKDTTTMLAMRLPNPMMAPDPASVNSEEEFSKMHHM
jgi:hypothetical protein